MFEIVRYSENLKDEWDGYVAKARNATFLFFRGYMNYHSDRFHDHSLLFYKKSRLYAVMPAHERGDVFCSHLGLTYGGLVMDNDVTAADVCLLFEDLNEYLKGKGFHKVIYKPVPWVYHQLPSEEDIYAIHWKCNARITRRDLGTVCFLDSDVRWRRNHRRNLEKALRAGVRVERSEDFDSFWSLLDENLNERHGVHPVHSLEEIKLLHSRFPDNILLYNAYLDNQLVAGYVFYITPQTVHGQYSSANALGKEHGALFAIYDRALNHDFKAWKYYDFGRSTEDDGHILNEGLVSQKEGFVGRGICYDTYEWELNH